MNKPVPVRSSPAHIAGITKSKERYYVQHLTEQIYVIRERLSTAKGPGPNDRIVARSAHALMQRRMLAV